MNPERAEAHLRLLAEAELRRAALHPGGHSARVMRVAQVLTTVGALDEKVAAQILDDFELALGTRPAGPAGQRAPVPGSVPRPRGPVRSPGPQVTSGRVGRVVPAGQLIPVRGEDVSGEVYLLSYAQQASRGLLTMIARPRAQSGPGRDKTAGMFSFLQFIATDDKGNSYGLGLHGSGPAGPGGWILRLHPDPPHDLRWLDLATTPGEPAARIDLPLRPDTAEVTVNQAETDPAEYLLNTIAMRLLATVAAYPRDVPLDVAGLRLGFAVDGLGDVIEALQAGEALPPLSPVPAQLAGLCGHLSVSGHGITAPPADQLPEPWRNVLFQFARGRTAPGSAGSAAAAVALPGLDGISLAILGLHDSADGTVLYLHASGTTRGGTLDPTRWPAIWIHDSDGWWHATGAMGGSMDQDGEVTMEAAVVPPISGDTSWIEVIAAGRSAEARVTLPLRWQ